MYRLVSAALVFVAGLVLAIYELVLGHVFMGLSLLPATFCLVLAALVGFEVWSSHLYKAVAAVSTMLTLVGVLATHPAYNVQLQVAYLEVMESFLDLESKCDRITPELGNARNVGAQACGLKGAADHSSGLSELTKGLHSGPAASLAGAAYSKVKSESPRIDPCARAYVAAVDVCPAAFSRVSAEGREALVAAAASK